jgi:5-methyltetrahydrofolate--homocysteine methyltransferase
MTKWQTLLDDNELILADGAMGTMLFDAGLQFGDPPERWNLDHADVVQRVHRGYLEAGAKILLTNTFGGNRFRLGMHGLDGNVAELNRAAADVAREAVRAVGDGALVAGDIGPSGRILAPLGDMEFPEAADGFAEQAAALAGAGVDLFWIETMSDLEEVHAAIEGVRQAAGDVPLITTMTFDTRGRTMMGVTPEQAARALLDWGSLAVGGNCGNGPDEIEAVVSKMHAVAPDAILVAKANAGIPRLVEGRAVYGAGPAEMARYASAVVRAGARIVGACCGSTPAHLEAMAESLAKERTARKEST